MHKSIYRLCHNQMILICGVLYHYQECSDNIKGSLSISRVNKVVDIIEVSTSWKGPEIQ